MNLPSKRISLDLLPDHHVYHEIMDRLLERLAIIRIHPKKIVLMGCHQGNAQQQLKQRYPESIITSVMHHEELHDLPDESIDLIIAHGQLLRERDPLQLLRIFSRLLCEEGLLLFTTLGPDSLKELRVSFAHADSQVHVHAFKDMHDIGDWMHGLHFSDPVVDREEIVIAYEDLALLFDDLKTCGASNGHEARQRSLFSPKKWQAMLKAYEQFKTEDYFPATLEVIYGHGWKVKRVASGDDEIVIPVDRIGRK